MKKLLIATDGFLPRWDGISSFLNQIIPRISDSYELTIVAPNLGEMKTKYSAKLFRFKTFGIRLADNYYASFVNPFVLSREIKKNDIVFVQCLGPIGILSILIAKANKKKLVFYNHMLEWEVYPQSQGSNFLKVPLNILTKKISLWLYNKCDMIIVPSIEHTELLNLLGVKSQKKVVPLGVDVQNYKPPVSKAAAKQELGIDPEKFVVGYAGRVSLEKDLATLYRAFMKLSKDHKNIVLLIAGGGRPELEKLFIGKENIILTGPKDNLAPYYQAMDVYVLPSLTETSSLTTMEAMASGLSVITTPVGFIKEYINDGTNGMLFSKKNSYSLYKKIEYLKVNQEQRDILGKKARETIVDRYTWDKTADGIKNVINNM